MKSSKSFFLSVLVGLASISTGIAIGGKTSKEEYIPVDAAASANYYTNADTSSKEALIASLKTITSTGFKSISYSSLPNSAYKTTEKTTGDYINDYYQKSYNYKLSDAGSSASNVGQGWNKEHTIPQSYWGKGTTQQGCDCIIVLPTDIKCNSERGNLPYGETNASPFSPKSGCKKGTSSLSGYNGTVFEPLDEYKGDLARIYFYSIVRWDGYKFTQSSGNITFSGSLKTNYGLTNYGLSLLMKWHKQDPVSDWEKTHNDRVQQVQNNRNPFVDHPEWADYIWGNGTGGTVITPDPVPETIKQSPDHAGTQADPYSAWDASLMADEAKTGVYVVGEISEINGKGDKGDYKMNIKDDNGYSFYLYYAKPGSFKDEDIKVGKILTINGDLTVYNGTKEMKNGTMLTISDSYPSGWTVDNGKIHVKTVTIEGGNKVGVNYSIQLKAILNPSNPVLTGVTWRSDDTSVATVDKNGKVTGVKVGSTVIRATSNDRNKVAQITIEVVEGAAGEQNTAVILKGCNGSLMTPSLIISISSLLGLTALIITKKKRNI